MWLHQFELDRLLAQGADPAGSPPLRARAELIATGRFRRELVAHLQCVQARAEHPPHWHSATLPVCAADVRTARSALDALAAALTADPAPAVRGLALAARLINDPHGPLYQRAAGADIAALARDVTAHLGTATGDAARVTVHSPIG